MNNLATVNQQISNDVYTSSQLNYYAIEDVKIPVRVAGKGPALIFIHGYPVHSFTWRKLLPQLSQYYTCYLIDMPGLGDSQWAKGTDFSFTAQTRRLISLLDLLLSEPYHLVAHDTGATIARLIASEKPNNVNKLVIFNTEMPGHRPPWIQTYQLMAKLPGSLFGFRMCFKSSLFLRSSLGMREFYSNKLLFNNPENLKPYTKPLVEDPVKLFGAIAYLGGIEWSVVDGLASKHKQIKADTLFLWGEDDKTFPVQLGHDMSQQFGGITHFIKIKGASLMPHEEQPELVVDHMLKFLTASPEKNAVASVPQAV